MAGLGRTGRRREVPGHVVDDVIEVLRRASHDGDRRRTPIVSVRDRCGPTGTIPQGPDEARDGIRTGGDIGIRKTRHETVGAAARPGRGREPPRRWHDAGVRTAAHVLVTAQETAPYCCAGMALRLAGAVTVPQPAERTQKNGQAWPTEGPRAIVTKPGSLPLARAGIARLPPLACSDAEDLDQGLGQPAGPAAGHRGTPVSHDDVAVLIPTSGTTAVKARS